MSICIALVKRNTKLFFKDKGMFFASLITPAILLILYATFLGQVYRDSFTSALPESLKISDALIDGCVGGQLISSILAVSCVTVAFCSNLLMVQDKANGSIKDFQISPVKSSILAMSYSFASLLSTLIICLTAACVCLVYVAAVGWYLKTTDILLLLLDIFLLTLFGTALSSIIHFFLSTQGQISAVGTIISAGYGFICGAYMPIYTMGSAMRSVTAFLPGTYSTVLFRQLFLRGALDEMRATLPAEAVDAISKNFDCEISFFGTDVPTGAMFLIVLASAAAAFAALVVLARIKARKKPGRS